MKIIVIVAAAVLVLIAIAGIWLKQRLSIMARGAKAIIVLQRLGQAAVELRKSGTFTNDAPNLCEIYRFTNNITVGQTQHQCVLAARSPVFAEGSFIAITTNDVLVRIDRDGKATPLNAPETVTP